MPQTARDFEAFVDLLSAPPTTDSRIRILDGDTLNVLIDSYETAPKLQHKIVFPASKRPAEIWVLAEIDGWPRLARPFRALPLITIIDVPQPATVTASGVNGLTIERFTLTSLKTPHRAESKRSESPPVEISATFEPGAYRMLVEFTNGVIASTDRSFAVGETRLLIDLIEGQLELTEVSVPR